jgi:hypothetical protein
MELELPRQKRGRRGNYEMNFSKVPCLAAHNSILDEALENYKNVPKNGEPLVYCVDPGFMTEGVEMDVENVDPNLPIQIEFDSPSRTDVLL